MEAYRVFQIFLLEQWQDVFTCHLGQALGCFASGLCRFPHPRLINLKPLWWEVGLDTLTCKRRAHRKKLCFSFGLWPLYDALGWCVWGLCSFFCRSSEEAFSRCTLTSLPLLPRSPSAWQKRERHMGQWNSFMHTSPKLQCSTCSPNGEKTCNFISLSHSQPY